MSTSRARVAESNTVRARARGWRATYAGDHRPPWYQAFRLTPLTIFSMAVLAALVVIALLGQRIAPHDAWLIDPGQRLQEPSARHWAGTDELGRDVLSRVMVGTRTSLIVGVVVTAIAAGVGTLVGLVAGYYRRIDPLLMRIMDGMMAFPGILLALAVVISLGATTRSVIIALTLVYIPTVARLLRALTLVITRMPYVEAARALGQSDLRIILGYCLKNSVSPLIVQCTFIAAYAILAEASLSFLGAGGDPEAPSWGNMLRDGQRLIGPAWWIAVVPGVVMFIVVLALNVVGDALRDALDPRTRQFRDDGVAGMS